MEICQSKAISGSEQHDLVKRCVAMKGNCHGIALAVAVSLLTLFLPKPGHAIDFYTDRASWEAAVPQQQAVNIAGQVPEFAILSAGHPLSLPFGESLIFSINLQGLRVPSSWSPPWLGGNPDAVLFTQVADTLAGSFRPQPVIGFGLNMEPNNFAVFNVTLTTADGGTHTLTQAVNGATDGPGGAFFGWIGSATSMQITCSGDCRGFVIGDLAIAGFAGTPGASNCHGQAVAALARRYGTIDAAASALGFPSVTALQTTIKAFCHK